MNCIGGFWLAKSVQEDDGVDVEARGGEGERVGVGSFEGGAGDGEVDRGDRDDGSG